MSVAELLAFLQEHGFLTASQLQQVRGTGTFSDAKDLARELVGRNLVTPYQANQLLQGRGAELILGPYRILDRLGAGGMGQVYKALHLNMDRVIALKVITKDLVSSPVAVGRFYREVRAVAKLSHPNIVIAFEVNQIGETHFLAMEYMEGIDLAKLVHQSGPVAIPNACDYVRQAALGLQHAHEKGLVHRDIKPSNLVVSRPNPQEPPVVKILDFGLARFESESTQVERLTQLGKIVGTVDYIAPEQAQNARTADIRADIFSLGCTLFYLLTGNAPFQGNDAVEKLGARMLGNAPSVRSCRPEVTGALEGVLAKMMARNPDDRYQTPGEVAKALQPHTEKGRLASGKPTPTPEMPVAHMPKLPTAPAAASSSTRASLDSRESKRRPKATGKLMKVGIGAAFVLLLLAILAVVGVIAWVAPNQKDLQKSGPALVQGDVPEKEKTPSLDKKGVLNVPKKDVPPKVIPQTDVSKKDIPKTVVPQTDIAKNEVPKSAEDVRKEKKPKLPAEILPTDWKSLAPMPTARSLLAAVTGPDGRIYAIGGENASGRLANVEVYDPSTNTWAKAASMPTARNHLAAAVGPDNLIYAIGGVSNVPKIVEAYNPRTNKWTKVAPMPTARHGLAAVTGPDGRIYAIGGSGLNTVEAYDTKSNLWTAVASMPTARTYLAAATGPDGRIYAIGGYVEKDGKLLDTVEVYDTKTNTWATVANMPTARNALSAATGSDGRIYAIGGHVDGGIAGIRSTVEAYNPSTNTWTAFASLPTVRGELAATTGRDCRIYVIGGGNASFLNTVEALSFIPSK